MNEFFTRAQSEGAAAIIQNRSRYQPTVGLILGSGLSSLGDAIQYPDIIPYREIPHWPVSTVHGHSGRLLLGNLEGQQVLVMQGRAHFYEGYSMSHLTLPVRVMNILGIKTLLVTNAAGGINAGFQVGDLMLIRDQLNFPGMAGHNPLRGPNDDSAGPRFPDMSEPYDGALRAMAHQVARTAGFTLQEGVYACVAGPNYESPAELRFLRLAGADAVGMSTAPEVLVARHAGMRVLGISTITNMVNLDPLNAAGVSHEEVLAVGSSVIPRLVRLIHGVLSQL
ncbi:MAG: purine-nucleoside phosphorylase [Ardenticatenaceae bacterium]|nr:purine-nucleoside phosphorylase [Anaerolineales bacterium]MCB8919376.1 purine-nucleoside phosphorylase [Ardenticatenaceae bacterium]